MKALLILLAATLTTSAFAHDKLSDASCVDYIAGLEAHHQLVSDRFRIGELTIYTVNFAELSLLDARLECRKISMTDYCAQAPKLAKSYVDNLKAENITNSLSPNEVIRGLKLLAVVNNRCN